MPIANSETAFDGGRLLIAGYFGSYGYLAINGESPFTEGSLTFTALDTALIIAGSFSDGASLTAASLSDDSIIRTSIAGSFIASKGVLPSSLAKRVRVLSDVF